MRSQFADIFNHDAQADRYDSTVADESHPIRKGYWKTLQTVAACARERGKRDIVDLGSGTGNLSQMLSGYNRLVCVDISKKMHDIARHKFLDNGRISYVEADLLEYFDSHPRHDMVVSTYAVHHLTDDEKLHLFRELWRCLPEGGVAVFGDLMFVDQQARERAIKQYLREGQDDVVKTIKEEFHWDVGWVTKTLTEIGFLATTQRIAELSWILIADRPIPSKP